jgi:hypothetical protein
VGDYALSLASLRVRARALARDTLAGERFTDQQVDECLVDALLDFVGDTELLNAHVWIPLRENVYIYDLPSDMFRCKRVWFSDLDGWVCFPWPHSTWDSAGGTYSTKGDPFQYFRDLLPPGKIWVYYIPHQDGSTFTRDSIYGLIRAIRDADTGESVPFSPGSTGGLRTIEGVAFEVVGDGHIIRDLIPTTGNLRIDYIRYPRLATDGDGIDADIPEHYHRDLPSGAAFFLLERYGNSDAEDRQKMSDNLARWEDRKSRAGAEKTIEMFRYGARPG